MGYNRQEIEDSLSQVRYDDVFATYLLLGRKSTDVSINYFNFSIIINILIADKKKQKKPIMSIKKSKILFLFQL